MKCGTNTFCSRVFYDLLTVNCETASKAVPQYMIKRKEGQILTLAAWCSFKYKHIGMLHFGLLSVSRVARWCDGDLGTALWTIPRNDVTGIKVVTAATGGAGSIPSVCQMISL
jgi:hypothetical protein